MFYNTNSHKHDSHTQFQFKLCDTVRFRNVMKATILIYVTGIVMDSHTEMASKCKT
jgi:hypothetical protein